MPSKMVEFNKHLQILSFDEQISEINFVIDKMLISNTIVQDNNVMRRIIPKSSNIEISEINFVIDKILISNTIVQDNNVMRKIIPKSSNIDSFRYSILISLHYYDISYHPERISKLKPFEDKYNFTHTTPNEFEINNPNISLTVYDENDKIVYISINNSNNKA